MKTFKSLVVRENSGQFTKKVEERTTNELPDYPVLVRVKFSALNYKDALSAAGNKAVTKNYPHTPGIDAAGIVEKSSSADFKEGDEVIVTSYDLGMNTSGGLSEYIAVPAEWVVPKPKHLSLHETMVLGTAGFTVGIGIRKLTRNLQPITGEFIVTGATGGVGSLAVAMLSRLGFNVVAASGKPDMKEFLTTIGASRITDRKEILDTSNKPLLSPIWSGGFDTLGGDYLVSILKATKKEGCVVSTGLASSPSLNATVLPFILNGINLLGVNSADCPRDIRVEVWAKLDTMWETLKLSDISTLIATTIPLEDTPSYLDRMLKGEARGKIVVSI